MGVEERPSKKNLLRPKKKGGHPFGKCCTESVRKKKPTMNSKQREMEGTRGGKGKKGWGSSLTNEGGSPYPIETSRKKKRKKKVKSAEVYFQLQKKGRVQRGESKRGENIYGGLN